jgi:transposase-like protein
VAPNLCYRWSKEFREAGKKRLVGDTTRASTEVTELRKENARLKQVVAETVLENRRLTKDLTHVETATAQETGRIGLSGANRILDQYEVLAQRRQGTARTSRASIVTTGENTFRFRTGCSRSAPLIRYRFS